MDEQTRQSLLAIPESQWAQMLTTPAGTSGRSSVTGVGSPELCFASTSRRLAPPNAIFPVSIS